MRRIITAAVAATLLIAACGGPASPEDEYVSLLVGHFLDGGAETGGLAFTEGEAACAAEAIVADFGVTGLESLGYDAAAGEVPNPEALGPGDGGGADARWFGHIDECIDLPGQVAAMFREAGFTDDVAACVAATYYESGLAEEALMSAEYDAALNARVDEVLSAAIAECNR